MAIRFLCPFGHHLVVPDNRAGKKGRCPECQQKVIVPVPNPVSSKQERAAKAAGKEEEKEDLDPWDAFVDDLIGADRTPGGQQLGFEPDMLPPPVDAPVKRPSTPPTQSALPKSSSKDEPPIPPAAPRTSQPKPSTPQQASSPQSPAPPPPASKPRQGVPVPPPPPPRRSNPPTASMAQVEETPQREKTEPRLQGYRPDRDSLQTVHWLAVCLALVTAFSAVPVAQHWNLAVAPVWAQVVWLLVVCQLVYIAWLVSLPDWSTAWMGVLVFTPVAAIYGGAIAIVLATPLGKTLVLDLADVRDVAAGWSAATMMLMALMSFACGRVGSKWHRRVSLLPRSLRSTSALPTASSRIGKSAWSAV